MSLHRSVCICHLMSVLAIPPGCPTESASKMLRSNWPWMESPTRRTLPMRSKSLLDGREEREGEEEGKRGREEEGKRERGKERGRKERK